MSVHRTGKVSSVDELKAAVRVAFFASDESVSDWLPVVFLSGQYSMPKVGDTVVCLTSGRDGFVLGTYYGEGESIQGNASKSGVWFEDGSHVYYDKTEKKLHIKAASGVRIEGNLEVTGTITRAGVTL